MVLFIIFVVGSVVFEYAITCCGRVMIDFMKTESLRDVLTRNPYISGFLFVSTIVEPRLNRCITYFSRINLECETTDDWKSSKLSITISILAITVFVGDVKKPAVNFVEGEYPVNVFHVLYIFRQIPTDNVLE
jgi:hypothetical protein